MRSTGGHQINKLREGTSHTFCRTVLRRRAVLLHSWRTYLMYVLALPSGKTYGCFFLKTWPTRLQGRISRLPPHCHTRNEISAHTNAHSRPVFSPRHRPAPSRSFSRWLPAPHQFPVVFNQAEDLSKQPHVSLG